MKVDQSFKNFVWWQLRYSMTSLVCLAACIGLVFFDCIKAGIIFGLLAIHQQLMLTMNHFEMRIRELTGEFDDDEEYLLHKRKLKMKKKAEEYLSDE